MLDAQPPRLWPFAASGEVIEVLEWNTNVLTARAGEQRIALRTLPRDIVTLTHRVDALGLAKATELARAGFAGPWLLPMWHMAQRPTVDLAQGSAGIHVPTGLAAFDNPTNDTPTYAAIAIDGGPATAIEITAIEPDRLILAAPMTGLLRDPLVRSTRVAVMPLRPAQLAAPIEATRRRQNGATITATFLLQAIADLPAPDLPTYQGAMVQTNPSQTRALMASNFKQAVEYIDNGFGPVAVEPLRDIFERGETITFKAKTPTEHYDLRRWLFALRGRQIPFWLPTWGAELQLRIAMTASTTLMRIAPIADLSAYAGRHIMIETSAGLKFRKINAAALDGANHRLTLSSSLGIPLPLGAKVHFLTIVRADADRMEVRHGAVGCEVGMVVVDVAA
jgi:hypothetical protein